MTWIIINIWWCGTLTCLDSIALAPQPLCLRTCPLFLHWDWMIRLFRWLVGLYLLNATNAWCHCSKKRLLTLCLICLALCCLNLMMRASLANEFIGRMEWRDPLWCLQLVTSLPISHPMISHGGSTVKSRSRVLHILGIWFIQLTFAIRYHF